MGPKNPRQGVMADEELRLIAETIDRWVQPVPGVKEVYLFGSRVRGNHRPDSDIDLRIFPEEFEHDSDRETTMWWTRQNETCCAELKSQLRPYVVHIHRDREIFDDLIGQEHRPS